MGSELLDFMAWIMGKRREKKISEELSKMVIDLGFDFWEQNNSLSETVKKE